MQLVCTSSSLVLGGQDEVVALRCVSTLSRAILPLAQPRKELRPLWTRFVPAQSKRNHADVVELA